MYFVDKNGKRVPPGHHLSEEGQRENKKKLDEIFGESDVLFICPLCGGYRKDGTAAGNHICKSKEK